MQILRHEPDIAFRRRAAVLFDYLDPQPTERVLDCGCGLGFWLHLLAMLASSELHGVEPDQERLREAASDSSFTNARVVVGDGLHLPYRDESFDKVLLSEVLEHVEDDAGLLREATRVTRRGGIVAISVPHRRYPFLWDPVNGARQALGLRPYTSGFFGGLWTGHLRLYSPDELSELVKGAGLRQEDMRQETRYSLPFSHNIIYGLGKALLQLRAKKDRVAEAGRYAFWGEQPRLTPVLLGVKLFTAIDRFNEGGFDQGPAVNICVKARRPSSAEPVT
jgi:SAM-dependent methyltransferase